MQTNWSTSPCRKNHTSAIFCPPREPNKCLINKKSWRNAVEGYMRGRSEYGFGKIKWFNKKVKTLKKLVMQKITSQTTSVEERTEKTQETCDKRLWECKIHLSFSKLIFFHDSLLLRHVFVQMPYCQCHTTQRYFSLMK